MIVSTAGSMGDSIYQTLFLTEFLEATKISLDKINIQFNKPMLFFQKHVYGNKQLTKEAAEFLLPLYQNIFPNTTIEISETCNEDYFDLDNFRKLKINFSSFDIRLWVYSLTNLILPMNLSRQIIKINDKISGLEDKILITKSDRYCNCFLDWNVLNPLKNKLVFIGLEEEHKHFCDKYFKIEFIKPNDALHTAILINSCKHYIANQTGFYAIAEMMKKIRSLCTCEIMQLDDNSICQGPNNVIPQNNCITIQTTERLQNLVNLLS